MEEATLTREELARRAEVRAEVERFLTALGIPFRCIEHGPTASMEECATVEGQLGAPICKNYFLSTRAKNAYCLCIVRGTARFRTSDISRQAGTSRLSFGSEEDMLAMLRTRPGSVSPMGLIFDAEHKVRLLMDRALRDLPQLAFHPCDNTRSFAISHEDFFDRFLPAVGIEPVFIDIHDFDEPEQNRSAERPIYITHERG